MTEKNFDYDVAIIGAGAAGVGATRRLAGGALSTIVLEASGRVGGRAWTEELAGDPVDLGCGYLHSGARNPWVAIAEASGFVVDRREPAWQATGSLGLSESSSADTQAAYEAWEARMREITLKTDRASDALNPHGEWNNYLQAMSGYINGAALENISIADLLAYMGAATEENWRLPHGYGALVASALPQAVNLRLGTPLEAISLDEACVKLQTRCGTLRTRAVIFTVSTAVLAGDGIRLPSVFDACRHAATLLPLGQNEKYFLQITDGASFARETHGIGNPRDPLTASYYIRPFGRQIIECFTGGAGAEMRIEAGPAAAYQMAIDDIVALHGASVRKYLRPLICSNWGRSDRIGGAYSHALPGHAAARPELAKPLDGRVFFAGEATHKSDFSTAHGALVTGARAADEVVAALR